MLRSMPSVLTPSKLQSGVARPAPLGLKRTSNVLIVSKPVAPSPPNAINNCVNSRRSVLVKAANEDDMALTAEQAAELEMLRASAPAQKNLGFIAFWVQFALSIVSAGILIFSVAFVPKAANAAVDVSKYLTLVGVVAAFISTFFAHGFYTLAKKLQAGGTVSKSWVVSNLLTNNTINLAGIGITVIGLQASVGTLVAKTLMTAVQAPFSTAPSGALVSLDVFALQASTNILLCHVVGLLFTNVVLRMVNKTPAAQAA